MRGVDCESNTVVVFLHKVTEPEELEGTFGDHGVQLPL